MVFSGRESFVGFVAIRARRPRASVAKVSFPDASGPRRWKTRATGVQDPPPLWDNTPLRHSRIASTP